jgi:hypothetical protein
MYVCTKRLYGANRICGGVFRFLLLILDSLSLILTEINWEKGVSNALQSSIVILTM